MSSQSVKVMVPPVVDAPRGAEWAAAVAVWIGRAVGARRKSVARTGAPAGSVKRLAKAAA